MIPLLSVVSFVHCFGLHYSNHHLSSYRHDKADSSILLHSSTSSSSSGSVMSTQQDNNNIGKQTATLKLYDVPVSNNGARCRIIMYKKGLTSEIEIVSPVSIGGLQSSAYLQINPQAKMPALECSDDINLAESDTIARYLVSRYENIEPSFQPNLPLSNYICRIHDIYMQPIQGSMYKANPPFGTYGTRKDALVEYVKQMNIIDNLISDNTLYLCGNEISLADATMFPSLVFATHMLPKFDMTPPPKLIKWFDYLKQHDDVFAKVYDEIINALYQWDQRGRWDAIYGAGLRDTEQATIFDKIISGDIPATIVKETDKVLAFKDINPAAPAHILVIPKVRSGLTRLSKATAEHTELLGQCLVVAAEISKSTELGFGDGARIVINDGPDGGQEVMHLHIHVIGGRSMKWPPFVDP